VVLTWAFRAGECDACGQGAQPYKAGQAREYESVLLTKSRGRVLGPDRVAVAVAVTRLVSTGPFRGSTPPS